MKLNYPGWSDNIREEAYRTEEELASLRENALQQLREWPDAGRFPDSEDNMLWTFSELNMEKELFEIGDAIVAKYPDPEDSWYLSETVYLRYGRYFLKIKKQEEALRWYMKAAELDPLGGKYFWEEIAACYAELRDVPNADSWIEKCMEQNKKDGKDGWLEWVNYADYFLKTDRPERALSICEKVLENHKYTAQEIWYIMAGCYQHMEDYSRMIAMLQTYVDKFNYDGEAHCDLALAVYNYEKDVARSEKHYLKAFELLKDKPEYKHWIEVLYDSLTIIHFNEGYWEKGFSYLRQYFEVKYPPEQYLFFKSMIDEMLPQIENNDIASHCFHFVKQLEESHLRPGSDFQVEGMASDNPSEEVKGTHQKDFDISKLTDPDSLQAN